MEFLLGCNGISGHLGSTKTQVLSLTQHSTFSIWHCHSCMWVKSDPWSGNSILHSAAKKKKKKKKERKRKRKKNLWLSLTKPTPPEIFLIAINSNSWPYSCSSQKLKRVNKISFFYTLHSIKQLIWQYAFNIHSASNHFSLFFGSRLGLWYLSHRLLKQPSIWPFYLPPFPSSLSFLLEV